MMEWSDNFSVGVPVLDADHKRLFDIINRVDEAAADGSSVDWVLQDLAGYVYFHFRREEFRMVEAGYPDIDRHMNEHAAFREWLDSLTRTLEATPGSHAAIAVAVSNYLQDWLTTHILKTDMAYKGYLA